MAHVSPLQAKRYISSTWYVWQDALGDSIPVLNDEGSQGMAVEAYMLRSFGS